MRPNLDWLKLRRVSTRPKLQEICKDSKHLFDAYYQIGNAEYVWASHQWDPNFTEKADFIIAFYWAPTPAIFHRITSRNPDAIAGDNGVTQALPEGLLLAPECKNCGTIKNFVEANGQLPSGWQNQYDTNSIATGCCFSVERLIYHFRSSIPVPPDESPYAVILRTNDDHWRKLGGSA